MKTVTRRGKKKISFCTDFLAGCDKKFSVTIGIPAYNECGRVGRLHQVLHQNVVQVNEIIMNTSRNSEGTQGEGISTTKYYEESSSIKIINDNEKTSKAGAFDEFLKTCNLTSWFSRIEKGSL